MSQSRGGAAPNTDRRMSVTSLWALANQQDAEIEDELTNSQKRLKALKTKISTQSKKNFVLERDVRYLDSRIALLIQHRTALDEELSNLEEVDQSLGNIPEDRRRQTLGNLFFLLQTVPKIIATLTRLVNMAEIDSLMQTVMFTLFGNQYEAREEHLLLSVFQLVLQEQFDELKDQESNSLMRANTPASRMMTTYTRRGPGQSYLKQALSGVINRTIQGNENLELNPIKVYEQMINDIETQTGTCELPRTVTMEEAEANPQVQALIRPRIAKLREYSEAFVTELISSKDKVPYGIRWICKQIRTLAKRRFDATDSAVAGLVGGFFMLRFVNPAIVTPQAYMLVEGQPSGNARRGLTLIAKNLQNLTNKPNYAKEAYMMPLARFIEENTERMTRFYLELCDVDDFFEQLEIDQYMSMTRRDLSLTITLNEIYATQELLARHVDVLAPNETDHLRILLNELGAAPKQVARNENKPIQLSLFSRWEVASNDDLVRSLNQRTPQEVLYQDTKALIVQILRSVPPLKTRPLSLQAVVDAAMSQRVPDVVRKAGKVKENLRKLEADGIISAADDYAQLSAEVGQELLDLEKLVERVHSEAENLEAVFSIIRDHNNYLRSQLESYKAYLQNVRMHSAGGAGSAKITKGGKPQHQVLGPIKFTHTQLEKDGVIIESDVPENRRSNIFFNIMSPMPGSFIIALHYRGRDKPILELDLKLDDLLEKQQSNDQVLDLEYVQLNVNRTLHLLNKNFLRR